MQKQDKVDSMEFQNRNVKTDDHLHSGIGNWKCEDRGA